MKYVGIDLHSNSMTVCYMETGKEEIIKTYQLTDKDIASFCTELFPCEEVAVEATGNTEF